MMYLENENYLIPMHELTSQLKIFSKINDSRVSINSLEIKACFQQDCRSRALTKCQNVKIISMLNCECGL